MLTFLSRVLGIVEQTLMLLAGCMLMLMLASMSADAVGRYLFNQPLPGNFEFTAFFSMVMLTFLALPRTYTLGGHVRLEVLQPLLRRTPFRLSERANALLGLLIFGAITYYTGERALEKIINRETTTGIIQLPIYISYVSFPLGCGVLALRMALELFIPQEHTHAMEEEL